MAERTEEPTPKKLKTARERGEVARSRLLGTAVIILAAGGALRASADHLLAKMTDATRLALMHAVAREPANPGVILDACVGLGAHAVLPVLATTVLAGGVVSFLQVGPLFTTKSLAPKPERLDPVKGLGRLFGRRQWMELVRTLLVLVLVGWIAFGVLEESVRGIVGLTSRDATAVLRATGTLVGTLLFRVGGALALVAVVDVLYQRWQHRRDQRMTKEEVKREHKEAEGDPHAKQARQRAHREIVDHAVLEEVRGADVLVVNPTHLAIALRYDEDAHEAPEVRAKGQDHLAQRMIAAAQQAGVPVLRDVPLARALFDLEIGDEIPEVLYEAVAAVLRAAWREREEDEAL